MNNVSLYILKFTPIFKERIWGGNKLKTILGKKNDNPSIGESWEISDIEENYSIVSQGELKGKTLHELVVFYKEKLVGKRNLERFGTKFPLLIKFLDAKFDLSVQLHPGDELAKRKHNSLGKTEMWYVMEADNDANVIVGFNQKVDKELYQKHVEEKTIKDIIQYQQVTKGDTFFVDNGLIHAIGKGVLLLEIQQTSDITYRVYDWDRKDVNGNYRDLHHEDALEAINFTNNKEHKIQYVNAVNEIVDLVECTHFITKLIQVEGEMKVSHKELDSFVVYVCVEGSAIINSKNSSIEVKLGETVLIPAIIKEINILSKRAKLIQTYI